MNLLAAENITKTYGVRTLFDDITLNIADTDKIGLIGINGTGKSSFLRILAGIDGPDKGTVTSFLNPMKIEYLPQDPEFDPEATIIQQVFRSDSPTIALVRAYEETLESVDKQPENPALQEQLLKLTSQMNLTSAWELESQVKTILTRLGIHDFDAPMGTLSGGQKKRVALASALISPCDLLILDEPTNHMDNEIIDWLENHLRTRKGALIMVTHDRYFLDRVVNRTIELDHGQLFSYQGNYSYFVEKRLERRIAQSTIEQKRESLYKSELEWIRKGAKARTTKQKARIQRFEELKDSGFAYTDADVEISVAGSRLGRKIMEAVHISKSFGDRLLIRDFSYTFLREDRIGIIGNNGMGKSTLLNLLTGRVPLDSGQVELGPTVKISYISQVSEEMDPALRAIEYIRDTAEYVTTADGSKITASQMMEKFLFTGEMQYTYISKLSGGERRRLYFLKMLMLAPNVLILDEPTNDLDIDTLTVLENFIDEFGGVVITVSHDRYFLDRICNRIFSFEGNGDILIHTGNYSDTVAYRKYLEEVRTSQSDGEIRTSKAARPAAPAPAKKLKFTYKEQVEYDAIEGVIADLEARLTAVDEELIRHGADFVKLQELTLQKDALEEELLEKMERQEYLDALKSQMK